MATWWYPCCLLSMPSSSDSTSPTARFEGLQCRQQFGRVVQAMTRSATPQEKQEVTLSKRRFLDSLSHIYFKPGATDLEPSSCKPCVPRLKSGCFSGHGPPWAVCSPEANRSPTHGIASLSHRFCRCRLHFYRGSGVLHTPANSLCTHIHDSAWRVRASVRAYMLTRSSQRP